MDSYRQITQGVAADLNNSFGTYLQNFRKLDPHTFNQIKRQEEMQQRMVLAEQMHAQRQAATAHNVDRVSARKDIVRSSHNDRIKKRIHTQEQLPVLEKRKPGRPKKLPPVAPEPPAHTAIHAPS